MRPRAAIDAHVLLEQPDPIAEDGFRVLYRHYYPILVKYAARNRASDPEGIANLALLSGFRALNQMTARTEDTFGYYLTRAALGHIADEKRKARPETIELEGHEQLIDDPVEAFVDSAWLAELVGTLPPDQRDVIWHRFYTGLSANDTAAKLGKEPNAVYQLQHRAVRNLRRTVFAGVLALIVLIGVIAGRQALRSGVDIDSSPVDRSVEPAPLDQEPIPTTPPVEQKVDTIPNDTDLSGIGIIEAGGDDPSQTATGETPLTTQAPITIVSSTTTSQAPTTTAPSITSTAPTQASTPLNVCYPHLISLDILAVNLYNPESDHGRAADFQAPTAVRFLDPSGAELHRIDTTGPMVTGLALNSHGWMGDGNGTFALFNQAPTPTYWGVLTDADIAGGWAIIEALNPANNRWTTVPGCL